VREHRGMQPQRAHPPTSRIEITGLAKGLIAFGGALAGLAVFMALPWMFPQESDPHGGAYGLIGALCMAPVAILSAAMGCLVHCRQCRRRRAQ